ncbi:MAG: GAF domain-containing protein [Salibacteraceae bacterium]
MSNSKNVWQKVFYLGVNSSKTLDKTGEVLLSNQLAVLTLLLVFGALSYSLYVQNLTLSLGFMTLGVSLLAVLIFNWLQQTIASRMIFSIGVPLSLLFPLFLYGQPDHFTLTTVRITTFGFSVFTLVHFNYRNEIRILRSSLFINFLTLVVLDIYVFTPVFNNSFNPSEYPVSIWFAVVAALGLLLLKKNSLVQKALFKENNTLIQKSIQLKENNVESKKLEQQFIQDSLELKTRNKILAEHGQVMLKLTKSDYVQQGVVSGALEEVVKTVSLTLDISRVSVWEFNETELSCSRVFSKIDSKFYQGFSIPIYDLIEFKNELESRHLILSDIESKDDVLSPFYDCNVIDGNIKSIVCSPFFLNNKTLGVLICEQAEVPKNWSAEDLNFIKAASDVLSITHAASNIRNEAEVIKQQNEEIILKNQFIESQQTQLIAKNEALEDTKHKLVRSLNELKDAEAALAVKEAESRGVLDAINDHNLVVEYDLRGDIIWMNERTRELTQISQKDMAGSIRYSIKALLLRSNHFSTSEYDAFWMSMTRGVSRKYELKLSLPGNELWVAASFLPIRKEDNSIEKIQVIANDISTVKNQQIFIENQNAKLKEQRKEISKINNSLEQRVKERTEKLEQQNQQLTEYAFINAHLLRAPVCNIMGLIDLLKASTVDDDQKEIVDFLDNSTKELDEMVIKINRSIKKGYYDDPDLVAQVEHWKRKKVMREAITQN